jgi:hypothetical protein
MPTPSLWRCRRGSHWSSSCASGSADFAAVPGRGQRHWHPDHDLAFVLLSARPDDVQMIDLGEADRIDPLIADFRATVASPPWERSRGMKPLEKQDGAAPAQPADSHAAGARLRELLFDPLLPALGGDTWLCLCPDGDLARLPFEALPDREPGKGAAGRLPHQLRRRRPRCPAVRPEAGARPRPGSGGRRPGLRPFRRGNGLRTG